MNKPITLNDGTVLTGHVLETENRLFLYIYGGLTLGEVFQAVNDPDKTKKITVGEGDTVTIYKNYKHLCAISEESMGMISAVLKKG